MLDITGLIYYCVDCQSPVAQLVERVAVNHHVGSSSLSGGAT